MFTRIGDSLDSAREIATAVITELTRTGETVATCESLTAGLVAATLADVSGASAVLRGGLITYATELKAELAGVPTAALAVQGPVHPETARSMAEGAAACCGAHWGVSCTGVAGPDPQNGHAVGEVYFGFAYYDTVTTARKSAVTAAPGVRPQPRSWVFQGIMDEAGIPTLYEVGCDTLIPSGEVVQGSRREIRETTVLLAIQGLQYLHQLQTQRS
ncbi:MAG: nicotinamide-nucleotide amidohydrolase family protein [Corynebacterium sp.]|nr:nicotinamide-nucleotide amidohydrolase family protein [Corynebacterium sp.]